MTVSSPMSAPGAYVSLESVPWLEELSTRDTPESLLIEREEETEEGPRLHVLWTRRQRAAFEALDGADRPAPEDDEDDVDPPPRLGGWDPLAND